eukprot:389403-Alexandrium_andersonii.AAC.1
MGRRPCSKPLHAAANCCKRFAAPGTGRHRLETPWFEHPSRGVAARSAVHAGLEVAVGDLEMLAVPRPVS